MDKIKVLHISQATGGVQRHVVSVLERLDKGRFEIYGICPPVDLVKGVSADKESFAQAMKRAGAQVYPVRMTRGIRPISDLAAFIRIYAYIKKNGFDVVHAHSSKAGFLGRIAARIAGVPVVVYTPNSFAFDRPRSMVLQKIFYAALERFAGLFCDRVIAVCEGEKELAVKMCVLPAKKIIVVSNAVDLSDYSSLRVDPDRGRARAGVGAGERMVIQVGRIAAQKAPFDFIRAAALVNKDFPEARFLIAGDGPLTNKVIRYLDAKGYSGFIKVLQWRNDVKELIAVSDIFVLASLWEVLPNFSLLDAMALRKPVVITDTLGSEELVRDGYNGYLVPKGRPRLLAESIAGLLRLKKEEFEGYGAHSREIVEKRQDMTGAARQIERLYEELYEKKGRE